MRSPLVFSVVSVLDFLAPPGVRFTADCVDERASVDAVRRHRHVELATHAFRDLRLGSALVRVV